MGIAPEELDGIVANRHGVYRVNVRRYQLRVQAGGSGPFVNTPGTGATQTEETRRVYAPVAILPMDDNITGVKLYRLGL